LICTLQPEDTDKEGGDSLGKGLTPSCPVLHWLRVGTGWNADLTILGLAFGRLTNGTLSQTLFSPLRRQELLWWIVVGTQPEQQSNMTPREVLIARVIFKQVNGPQRQAQPPWRVTGAFQPKLDLPVDIDDTDGQCRIAQHTTSAL
jgi:hypothetical protein